jgi:sulfatase modifying factor 1
MMKKNIFISLISLLLICFCSCTKKSNPAVPSPPATFSITPTITPDWSHTCTPTITMTPTFTITPLPFDPGSQDNYEPDNTAADAKTISMGEQQARSLYPYPADNDFIKFDVDTFSLITIDISMDYKYTSNRVYAGICDSAGFNCRSIADIWYSGGTGCSLSPGSYTIRVWPYFANCIIELYYIRIQAVALSVTYTPTSTVTSSPTVTKTHTSTDTSTVTVTPTVTETGTLPGTRTDTPSPTHTLTITETFTDTETSTETPTITETHTISPTFTITLTPTNTCLYTEMVIVPGGTFQQENPTYMYESFTHTVSHFRIGKYEVAHDLWNTVRLWAVANGYNFAANGSGSGNLPIVYVSWRSAVVWCNAYSEIRGLNYVYYSDAGFTIPLKDSADGGAVDNAFVDWNSNGFRLPTEGEWVCAARYINGSSWTPSTFSSGAYNTSDTEINAVAWTSNNSGLTAKNVGLLRPNALGIYDMSGNAYELCWDGYSNYPTTPQTDYRGPTSGFTSRIAKGGAFYYIPEPVGDQANYQPGYNFCLTCGFRVAQKY